MRIDAFDLADVCGWASGLADAIPASGSLRLRKRPEPNEVGAQRLGQRLFARWSQPDKRPDVVVVERAQELAASFHRNVLGADGMPAFSGSADAIKSQILYHGAVHAIAGLFDIPVYDPAPATIRRHLCGVASAAPPRKRGEPPRSARQKEEDRQATKQMVLGRLMLLGYLPRDAGDTDRADAVAAWVWGASIVARAPPGDLHLFGETAP